MLERWYGVHITVSSPALLDERLTGEFDTETIQEVMNVLALTHGFTCSIDHKDITLSR
jgi:ferric-dicitrate binding protein FerR (iron transport regulator)